MIRKLRNILHFPPPSHVGKNKVTAAAQTKLWAPPVKDQPERAPVWRLDRSQAIEFDLLEKKWCPGAESNHRHDDFQSSALPLSYPGTLRLLWSLKGPREQ